MTTVTTPKRVQDKRLSIPIFWKILVWFWLAIIFLITLYLFIGYVNSGKIHYRPLPPPVDRELNKVSKRLENYLSKNFRESRPMNRRMREVYLLDQDGKEYFDKPIPEILIELHSRVQRHNVPLFAFQKRAAYFGGKIINIKNKPYHLYSHQREPIFSRHLFKNFFRDVAKALIFATFIISFPISFMLSWLITKPIKRLRQATQDVCVDLNDRKYINQLTLRRDEFGDLARDFEQMAEHLNQMLRSQRQLVSDVSHELRSPLTRMQIALGIIEQNAENKDDKHLKRLQLESQRMNQMLENLLALSRLEAQEFNTQKEEFDFCQLLNTVIEDGTFEAQQSNITITVNAPQFCRFKGYKEALISGIENILRNAIRYAGENGKIECRIENSENGLMFSIRDSGPGVEENQLDKLFDAFYRPEFDRSRDSGGVGLGLSIAKRAFALNKGTISAMNIQPHGLKIMVIFKNKEIVG